MPPAPGNQSAPGQPPRSSPGSSPGRNPGNDGHAHDPGHSLAGMVPHQVNQDHRARLLRAWSLMGQHHWQQALDTLDDGPRLGASGRLAMRTAANMAALQQHRPDLYPRLATLFPIDPPNRHYRPVRSKAGWLTVVVRTIEGDKLINPIDDPEQAAKRDLEKLRDTLAKDIPLLLAGTSDGYFLNAVVKQHPQPPASRHTAVYIIEPDPELLLANLALHDWSADPGPFASPWVEWFVGDDWAAQMIERFDNQWMLPVPGLVLGRKDLHDELKQAINRIKLVRKQTATQQRDHALQHGVYTARNELVKTLQNNAGRPPRVLIIGSQFNDNNPPGRAASAAPAPHSKPHPHAQTPHPQDTPDPGTEAQHAFQSLGWQTQHLTETAPHHRLTPLAFYRDLGTFKPDLVFAIGERWADRRETIDPRIPIIRWIDDAHRSKLGRSEKASLYLRDFVLAQHDPLAATDAVKGYPKRQLLTMPGIVRVVQAPVAAGTSVGSATSGGGGDLCYIGDQADDPRDLLFELVDRTTQPNLKLLLQLVGEEMLVQYETGKSFPTAHDIVQLTERLAPQVPDLKPTTTLFRQLARTLFHPFNDALYRQQTLQWAIQLADEKNLALHLYGKGWSSRRRFKRFAKGRVLSRHQHDKLTVQAKINLHSPPTFCLDARLMDGLTAGGFFLCRKHPADTLLPEFGAFLETYLPPEVDNCKDARKHIDAKHADQLERMIQRAQFIADLGDDMDPIRCVRAALRGGLIDRHHVALPRIDSVQFDSQSQLADRIDRYLDAPEQRLDIVRKQRTTVEHRLCFASGIARAITHIADLIAQEKD